MVRYLFTYLLILTPPWNISLKWYVVYTRTQTYSNGPSNCRFLPARR